MSNAGGDHAAEVRVGLVSRARVYGVVIMNCRQVKRLLPLWIGHDLADVSEAEGLRAHLGQCNDCSSQQRQLRDSLEALQSISTTSLAAEAGSRVSLWPRLAAVLKDVPRRRDHFNGWIPATAMALAASVMVAVSAIQVNRDMGGSIHASWGESRNLFKTDSRFAPNADHRDDLDIPGLVVQPGSQPNF